MPRACGHSFKPQVNPRQMEEGEEAQGCFVITGADTTKAFELIEHALDQVALFVEMTVVLSRCKAMASRRNHRLGPLLPHRLHDIIGVITLVGDDNLGGQPFEQGQGRVVVGARACRQDEARGITVAVTRRVNLGA